MCLNKLHSNITYPKTGKGFKALSKDGRPPFYTEVEGYPVKAGDVVIDNSDDTLIDMHFFEMWERQSSESRQKYPAGIHIFLTLEDLRVSFRSMNDIQIWEVEYHNILAQGEQLVQIHYISKRSAIYSHRNIMEWYPLKKYAIEYVSALVVKQVKYIRRIK